MSVRLWDEFMAMKKRLDLMEQRVLLLEKELGIKLEVRPTRDDKGRPMQTVKKVG